jgi:glycosyltransferase involved in cell wall biosynthesis
VSFEGPSRVKFPDYGEVSDPAALPANPVASVVVIAYRHEDYLEQTVDSIAAQVTSYPFEIVIAEDSSPDRSREIAERLQQRYPHLVRVVFTGANKGGGGNIVFAFHCARGRYISICEGDDFWIDDDKLERQINALERNPAVDLAFTRGYCIRGDGSRTPDWDYGDEERIIQPPELFATLGWVAPTAALTFRAEILKSLPERHEKEPFGDLILIMAGSRRGGAHYDPRLTVCYRNARENSFTDDLDRASPAERIRFLNQAIDYFHFACEYYRFPVRLVRHRIGDYRLSLVKLHLAEGRWLAAAGSFAAIRPSFLAKGAARRLRRVVSRA